MTGHISDMGIGFPQRNNCQRTMTTTWAENQNRYTNGDAITMRT